MKEKCERKGIKPEEIEDKLGDFVGSRVICKYLDKIPDLVEEIKKIPGLTVVKVKDYIKDPKPNGYAGYHLICKVLIPTKEGNKLLTTEVQIRTLPQDNWAAIEHEIRYKPKESNKEVDEEQLDKMFKKLAQACSVVDLLNMQIRDFYEENQ